MKLFHGTCACCAENILFVGLNEDSYLTSSVELAKYYASCATDECEGCDPAIIEADVACSKLRVDYAAYAEPISIYRNEFAADDREWHLMCESGQIPYPKDEFDINASILATYSVRHQEAVTPEQLKIVE